MTSPTDQILARYQKIERETDAFGRVIGVKRLQPSQNLKIVGFTADLEGINAQMRDETGSVIEVPYRAQAIFAAAVMEIDGAPIPFPRSRAELDAIMNRLDSEGMEAAARAFARLVSGDEQGGVEAAKNSPGMPTSDSVSG